MTASIGQTLLIAENDLRSDDTSKEGVPSLPEKRVVVGCGGAAVDFLASVASFPQPDEKIRTTELKGDQRRSCIFGGGGNMRTFGASKFKVQGGGNVGNALTAAARLGLNARVFTKVSNDGPGKQILAELEGDGVDTSCVVVAEGGNSPFTYVIVDQEKGTRTCIHTPGSPPLEPRELTPSTIAALLNDSNLVYLDGRLTDTAIILAKEATKRKLPILVDAERKREGLDDILEFADYIVASAKFPQTWTESPTLGEALLTMMLRLQRVKFLIVTLGASGCVMLERHSSDVANGEALNVNLILEALSKEAEGCLTLTPSVVSSKVGRLGLSSSSDGKNEMSGRLLVGTAVPIPSSELVDTTGAGDAFIGGVMYSLLAGLPPEKMLPLGAVVAAGSCRALGARTGLPHRGDTNVALFL